MKSTIKLLLIPILATLFSTVAQGQAIETTYKFHTVDHSAWKVQPNSPTGYVIMGNKFFEPANTSMYAQGFSETGDPLWLGNYPATGFSSLQTFWKSFILSSTKPVRYFAVAAGSKSGNKAFAILIDGDGKKVWDRVSDLPNGIQFGGVTNATNGGWLAVGSDAGSNIAVAKFDSNGSLQWLKILPISGFAWTVLAAPDGGYLLGSTTHRVTKIDKDGKTKNFVCKNFKRAFIRPIVMYCPVRM